MENQIKVVTFVGDQRGKYEDLYYCKNTEQVYRRALRALQE